MATQKELAELYVAVLGRAPDAEGFAYWTNALSQGATLEQINAEWMTNQVEVQTRYEGLNPDQFLSAIYENVLGRMPDAAGLAYWTPLLESGTLSRDTFVSAIIAGAKAPTGGASDAALLSNRAEIGLEFVDLNVNAGTLAADVVKLATADPASVSLAQSVLSLIPAAAASSQAAAAIADVTTLINNVVATVASKPEAISGLGAYLNAVSAQLAINPTANIPDIISAAAITATNVASDVALLDNVTSLAETTVTAPSSITSISPPPADAGGGDAGGGDAGGDAGGGGGGGGGADTTAPTLSSSIPADDATAVAVGSNIVLTFSENVALGTTGTIKLYKADNTLVETFDVSSDLTGKVTVSGTGVTINPTSDLSSDTGYYVQVDSGAIQDTAGNAYAGISNATTLNFLTGRPR